MTSRGHAIPFGPIHRLCENLGLKQGVERRADDGLAANIEGGIQYHGVARGSARKDHVGRFNGILKAGAGAGQGHRRALRAPGLATLDVRGTAP